LISNPVIIIPQMLTIDEQIEQIEEGGDIVDTTINDKTRMAIENLAYVHYCESK